MTTQLRPTSDRLDAQVTLRDAVAVDPDHPDLRRKWQQLFDEQAGVLAASSEGPGRQTELRRYYLLDWLAKMIGRRPLNHPRKHTLLVIASADGREVLCVRRGPCKGRYAATLTLSACDHAGAGRARAIARLKDELGLVADELRLTQVGDDEAYTIRLKGAHFCALTAEEADRLNLTNRRLTGVPDNVRLDYSEVKGGLFVSTVRDHPEAEEWRRVVHQIWSATSIPPLLDDELGTASLFVYRLTLPQEQQMREDCRRRNQAVHDARTRLASEPTGADLPGLAHAANDDTRKFIRWTRLIHQLRTHPKKFAADLIEPTLGDRDTCAEIQRALTAEVPLVLNLVDSRCWVPVAVGGKGSGLHLLHSSRREQARRGHPPDWDVPDGFVVTVTAYEQVIRGEAELIRLIAHLDQLEKDRAPDEGKAQCAQDIRARIEKCDIPKPIRMGILRALHKLGRRPNGFAVRSSATMEDGWQWAAAGDGCTIPNVRRASDLLDAIRKVWASHFSDNFCAERTGAGTRHSDSRMAVVVQPMVPARASGVLFSIDPVTRRPGLHITAAPGPCGVVDGKPADWYFASPEATQVLEARPAFRELLLTADEVLRLAATARAIRDEWRAEGLADEIDIEYAVAEDGRIFLLQAPGDRTAAGADHRHDPGGDDRPRPHAAGVADAPPRRPLRQPGGRGRTVADRDRPPRQPARRSGRDLGDPGHEQRLESRVRQDRRDHHGGRQRQLSRRDPLAGEADPRGSWHGRCPRPAEGPPREGRHPRRVPGTHRHRRGATPRDGRAAGGLAPGRGAAGRSPRGAGAGAPAPLQGPIGTAPPVRPGVP